LKHIHNMFSKVSLLLFWSCEHTSVAA